jgi:hypothetical protein
LSDVIRWRRAVVRGVHRAWPGAIELDVVADPPMDGEASTYRALAYPELVGSPEPGDVVLLNVNALLQGLGTGGHAMVIALPDRLPPDVPPAGHLVKARYTPLQAMVTGPDEPGCSAHEALRDAEDLGGLPVVAADLHSAIPAICAGILHDRPGTRIVHVMTDTAALPAWLSHSLVTLREAGWLRAVVSTGQAFGGDVECVSLHSGLLTAGLLLDAEVAVVTQGPGNLGTATRWGFSGVAAGEILNAAAVLGGRPVAALRVSAVDPRPRHRGVSHHSLTAYGRVALARSDVAVPILPGEFGTQVRAQCQEFLHRHRLVEVGLDGLAEALEGGPVACMSMGRGFAADPAHFLAAAAAGRHAAALLHERAAGSH